MGKGNFSTESSVWVDYLNETAQKKYILITQEIQNNII